MFVKLSAKTFYADEYLKFILFILLNEFWDTFFVRKKKEFSEHGESFYLIVEIDGAEWNVKLTWFTHTREASLHSVWVRRRKRREPTKGATNMNSQ